MFSVFIKKRQHLSYDDFINFLKDVSNIVSLQYCNCFKFSKNEQCKPSYLIISSFFSQNIEAEVKPEFEPDIMEFIGHVCIKQIF